MCWNDDAEFTPPANPRFARSGDPPVKCVDLDVAAPELRPGRAKSEVPSELWSVDMD
jgi:hypothetical protein